MSVTNVNSPTSLNPLGSPEPLLHPKAVHAEDPDPDDKKYNTRNPNRKPEVAALGVNDINLKAGGLNHPYTALKDDEKAKKSKLKSAHSNVLHVRRKGKMDSLKFEESDLLGKLWGFIEKKDEVNLKHKEDMIDDTMAEFVEQAKQARWDKKEFIMKHCKATYRNYDKDGHVKGSLTDSKNIPDLLKFDELISATSSPDGKFVAGLKGCADIVVFNLHVPPEEKGTYRILKRFAQFEGQRNPDEEDAQEFFIREGSNKQYNKNDLKMTFSPDSQSLIVSTIIGTVAYDLREFADQEKELTYIEIIPLDQFSLENHRGNIIFQFFLKNYFASSLYTPVDREILVVGCTKDIRFVIFCLDNFKKTKTEFLPTFTVSRYASPKYSEKFFVKEGKKAKKTEDEEQIQSVIYNGTNIIMIETKTLRKRYLNCYKLDFDNQNSKSKINDIFTKHELSNQSVIFPKTAMMSSGQDIFFYNTKKSEIQTLSVYDKKSEVWPVFKLEGKRKNLIHLAVKGDGKYLLIVDNTYLAEVFIKTVSGYTLIHSFDASILRRQISSKGLDEPAKAVTEQDLSDMDFLEDGSGIYSIFGITLNHYPLNLPKPLTDYCLFTNKHYFMMNLRKRLNNSYAAWLELKDTRYQKIIDFDPKTNDGCIVRTFKDKSLLEIEQILKPIGNIYHNVYCESDKAKKEGIDGRFPRQKAQLESFLFGEEFSDEVMVVNVPGLDQLAFLLKRTNKIITFDRKEILSYMLDATAYDNGTRKKTKPGTEILPRPTLPKPKGTFEPDLLTYPQDPSQRHVSGLFFDSKASHLILPNADDEEGGVILSFGQPPIEKGLFFFPLDNNRILVSSIDEEEAQKDDTGEKIPGTLQIFNLTTKSFEGTKTLLKHNGLFTFMLDTDISTPHIKALIGINIFGLFDANTGSLLCHDKLFSGIQAEFIPASIEFDTHCLLQSPDKKHIVMCPFRDCDHLVICSIDDKNYRKRVPHFTNKSRVDLLNRWCFSHDSKYLLVVVNDHIAVFSMATFSVITKINIDELAKLGKVMHITLYECSTELEIAVGYKNNIFFKRMPFYPKVRDLLFADIAKKMAEYERKNTDHEKDENATQLNEILISMPVYQRFLDTTYLKLLCLTNDSRLVKTYFQGLKETKDVIFKSAFSKLVTADSEMYTESVSCFIELLEYTLVTDGALPNIDFKILLAWLKSNKIKLTDTRKLMKLITFRPTSFSLQGELKDEDLRVVAIPEAKFKKDRCDVVELIRDELFEQDNINKVEFELHQTAIKFDFSIGSRFSLDYFRWMEKMTNEDLKTIYKPIIYYKWYKIYWFAIVYSVLFWILNALVCAFMAFLYSSWGLAIPIIVLNCLFLLYEVKCISADPKQSLFDPWTYVDIILHLYVFSCTLAVVIGGGNTPSYQYNWLRITSFVLVSFRGMTMLRIFRGTRYFITMLFMTFYKMIAYLSVFAYIIFIYWFVCLVRPSLVAGGQDEDFYTSVQDALNIAFSNFNAGVDSVIVLVTTIIANVVLALVLLNYLIAIISKVYDDISQDRDIYDIKMLLDIIVEFECFMMWRTPLTAQKEQVYCILLPKEEMTDQLKDIKTVFAEERKALETDIKEVLKAQEKEIAASIDTVSKENIETIKKAIGGLNKKIEEIGRHTGFKQYLEKAKNKEFSKDIQKKAEKKREELEKEAKDWKKAQEMASQGKEERLKKIKQEYDQKMKQIDEKIDNFRARLKEQGSDEESEDVQEEE